METPLVPGATAAADAFRTTHWSVVSAASQADTARSHTALAQLCQTYWQPLYAYVRRVGYSPCDAQDFTQEFFVRLLAGNSLAAADQSRGRFRSYLLASLKHFLANERDRARAQKRGGGVLPVPIDAITAETGLSLEPADPVTAEKLFERRWALTLLNQVLVKLRKDYMAAGKEDLFEQLKFTLTEASRSVPYAEIARRSGMTEGSVKVAVHRLRQKYRALLRAEIAQTVAEPESVEDELHSLFAALAD